VTVFLVGAGPGHPGLITRRGAEVLARADVVVHDRLVPVELLALAPPGSLIVDVGKRPGEDRRQEEINALLVEHAMAGRTVVRLKGGDPFVFGRGGEEAMALTAAGVLFEVVPGVTAAFAAPAYAGVPVTHRGLASSVTVVTGRVGEEETGSVDWESLGRAGGTLVVLMGMAKRADIARRLRGGGRPADTPVLVVEQGATSRQRSVRCRLDELHAVELGAPATIVIGEVARLDMQWFVPGPLAGRTVVVTRAAERVGALVEPLRAAGAQVVHLPVVQTVDPEDGGTALSEAVARAPAFSWVVFTSATAVDRALSLLPDLRALGTVRLAAVGPATAQSLRERQLVADLVAEPASAEGLVSCMPQPSEGANVSVLYPRAAGASPVLADGLRAKGWKVEDVVAYRTVALPAVASRHLLDRVRAADVITFTSPSTVHAFLEVGGSAAVPPLVACIGPVTAEAARRAGLHVDVVADEHSAEGLVAAVVTALS